MIKHIIVLPDGTEISSGTGSSAAILNVSHTGMTNDQTDLAPGSVCASFVEVSVVCTGRDLNISKGTEFALYSADESGTRKIGLFTAEKPTRSGANRYQITAYDRVSWLDKDLEAWIKGLDGWPYRLSSFAGMVCEKCNVPLAAGSFPNSDFLINKPTIPSGITGRQLMKWVCEIAARFCVANPEGVLEFGWYKETETMILPSGNNFYYLGSLSYENYQVEKIDAVKVRLAESDSGALWPEGEADNPYVITGNKLLLSNIADGTRSVIDNIFKELENVQYTPCRVTVPYWMNISAGDIVRITDINGKMISAYVMEATTSRHKTTVTCTGNAKRNSSEALNYLSNQQLKDYADNAVSMQTQEDIFNKLTKNGSESGIYLRDGVLYLNANYMKTGFLSADIIRAGQIRSTDFAIEELQEVYPHDSTESFIYPSNEIYPNNGDEIVRGFEIDFASGVIRGVFWSEAIEKIEKKLESMEERIAKIEESIS